MSFFENIAPGLAAGASAVMGHGLAQDLKDTGAAAQEQMGALAGQLKDDTAFKGYGVQTGLGDSTVDANGSTTLGVGPNQAMLDSGAANMIGADAGYANAATAASQLGGNAYAGQAANMAQNGASLIGANSSNAAYGQAMSGMNAASAAAGANSSNAAYGQAMAGLGNASNLAGANSSNAAYGQAMGGLDAASAAAQASNANAMLGKASGLMQGSLAGVGSNQKDALHLSRHEMAQGAGSTAAREQEIYNRSMAMQQPGLDAQRAQQQAREHAMGRGGVRGSQFGGTAEDAAMARAQAGAMNQASFQAMAQGQQEKMNHMQSATMLGQLGMQGQAAQAGVGQGLGALGAQNAQLGQSAAALQGQFANQQGALGAQNAQLGQAAAALQGQFANQQGALGAQNAQLGQAAAGLQGQLANQMGAMGAQNAQLGQSAGAQMGQLGGMLNNMGVANQGINAQNANLMASIAGQQGQLGLSQNQAAYLPMQQQMQAMQLAQGNAGMAQSGQFTGAGYGAQLGVGAIQADINAQKAASELYGNMFGAIMNNAGTIGAGLDDIINF